VSLARRDNTREGSETKGAAWRVNLDKDAVVATLRTLAARVEPSDRR